MKYEWDKNKIMKELKIIFSSSFFYVLHTLHLTLLT